MPRTVLSCPFYGVPPDLRNATAAGFHAKAVAWCLIPRLVTPAVLDLPYATAADLPALTAELLQRLERLERLQQTNADRHGIGGNQGPPLVDLTEPIITAKNALASGQADTLSSAASAVATFKPLLPDLAKGAMQEVGKHLAGAAIAGVSLVALWAFQEVCHVIPLLERWIDLVQAIK